MKKYWLASILTLGMLVSSAHADVDPKTVPEIKRVAKENVHTVYWTAEDALKLSKMRGPEWKILLTSHRPEG